jgi:hypothetical protein
VFTICSAPIGGPYPQAGAKAITLPRSKCLTREG